MHKHSMSTANWFIVSKHSLDNMDYRILAGSIVETESWQRRFKAWIKDEVSVEATVYSPGAPYYYFIPETIDGVLTQIIIRQTWTDYVDSGYRKVLTSSCLLLPYEVFNEQPCGFLQQAAFFDQDEVSKLLTSMQQTIRDGEVKLSQPTVVVDLPGRDEVENYLLSLFASQGFDFTQMVAKGLTTKKKVCIWEQNQTIASLQQRLEWLDAALIGLPYGVRAFCSAASWQNTYDADGDHLVVGRKMSSDLTYVSPGEVVDGLRLCEGYAAGIMRLLERGYSSEDLINSFLNQTETVNPIDLRYGPPHAEPLSPQERVEQFLTDPEVYSTREKLRGLIDEIKDIDANKINEGHMRTLLVRVVPALEARDKSLIKAYWSEALLTQSIASLRRGNAKILELLPHMIPYDMSEKNLEKLIEEVWDNATGPTGDLDKVRKLFVFFHQFLNERSQANPSQADLAISLILDLVSRSGDKSSLIWLHLILSPDSKYQDHFFTTLRGKPNSNEVLSVISSYWDEGELQKMPAFIAPYLILPLTKILLIRKFEKTKATDLVEVLVDELIAGHPQTRRPPWAEPRKPLIPEILQPYLDSNFWADYPQDGEVAAGLDVISFLVNKRWMSISNCGHEPPDYDSYRSHLSHLLKKGTLSEWISTTDRKEMEATLDVIEKKQFSNSNLPELEDKQEIRDEINKAIKPEDLDPEESLTRETKFSDGGETAQIASTLYELAQSSAKRIETARGEGDLDIWKTIATEIVQHTPTFSPQELEQYLLLVLGSIQKAGIRKETLTALLPIIYEEYSSSTSSENGDKFFESHSEFVSDVFRSYINAFNKNENFKEWLEHLSSLRQAEE